MGFKFWNSKKDADSTDDKEHPSVNNPMHHVNIPDEWKPAQAPKYVVDKVQRRTPYCGVFIQLLLSIFNPVTLGILALMVCLISGNTLARALFKASKSSTLMACKLLESQHSQSSNPLIEEALLSSFHSVLEGTVQQLDTNAKIHVLNARSLSSGYVNLTDSVFKRYVSGCQKSAWLSAQNATTQLENWSISETENAENVANILQDTIANITSVLGDSGLYSMQALEDITSKVKISMPTGLNETLFKPLDSDTFTVLHISALESIDTIVTKTREKLDSVLDITSLPSLKIESSVANNRGQCHELETLFEEIDTDLSHYMRTPLAGLGVFAAICVVLALLYVFFAWRNSLSVCRQIESNEGQVIDCMHMLSTHNSPLSSRISNFVKRFIPVKKVSVQWWLNFWATSSILTMMGMGIGFLILSSLQGNLTRIARNAEESALDISLATNNASESLPLKDFASNYTDSLNTKVNEALGSMISELQSIFEGLPSKYDSKIRDLNIEWLEPYNGEYITFSPEGLSIAPILTPSFNLTSYDTLQDGVYSDSDNVYSLDLAIADFRKSSKIFTNLGLAYLISSIGILALALLLKVLLCF